MSENLANLIANSSFGTEGAQELAARTSEEAATEIMARVEAAMKKDGEKS